MLTYKLHNYIERWNVLEVVVWELEIFSTLNCTNATIRMLLSLHMIPSMNNIHDDDNDDHDNDDDDDDLKTFYGRCNATTM